MATKLGNGNVTMSIDISELGRKFENGINDLKKKIASEALTELVVRTPIDEGVAKSNWQVALNQEAGGPVPAYVPGSGGSTMTENINQTIVAGRTVIQSSRVPDTINITNRLDYIEKLNNGSSSQAPAGFVEDAVVTAVQSVPGTKIIP